jgi:murein DD-endopeptidase MepM/ murein hydrolase activator NlpD
MTLIDTPAEILAWKARMKRVAVAHHVTIPPGFSLTLPTMGPQARELMHLLVSHANGYHGQHLTDDRTLNSGLQAWLLAQDPLRPSHVQPIPAGYPCTLIGGEHPTEGLPGFPAYDFGAPAGTPVVACEAGVIASWTGHDPALGPVEGVHGPFGWSVYLRGASGAQYYYTHLEARFGSVGMSVPAAFRLGLIGDYAAWHGVNHVHLGVCPPASGHPSINDVIHSPRAPH